MATFTVNTTADVVDGNYSQLSLREAVNRANSTTAADLIVFASALEGQTLVLTGGKLVLNQDTIMDGDQNNDGVCVSIDGNSTTQLMEINRSGTISGLTFQNGQTSNYGHGGAIYFSGAGLLSLTDCTILNCKAGRYDDQFDQRGNGGAIFARGGTVNIVNSDII